MKARKLRSLLERELGYKAIPGRGKGSHRQLESPNRPTLLFAFHDGDTISPARVRSILVKQVGLTLDEAKDVVSRA
jgi:predicted RNA binding protein YcfA (HicA-like mRNA interferase family)